MIIEKHYDFVRYLTAKKTIDDRSLNRDVLDKLAAELHHRTSRDGRLDIVEVGAGIGTMFERLIERDLLHNCRYTAVDNVETNIAAAALRIQTFCASRGIEIHETDVKTYRLVAPEREITLELRAIDVLEMLKSENEHGKRDLIIANAFLDLLDIRTALPQLISVLKPGGLFYFSLNFDGATIFQPTIDVQFDRLIEDLYHKTMDERIINGKPSGDSNCGRHLFENLVNIGARIFAAGSSDWVVLPGPHGYLDDDAFFLHFIIYTVGMALKDSPEIDANKLEIWLDERHRQVDAGHLMYIAHQIDYLGQMP